MIKLLMICFENKMKKDLLFYYVSPPLNYKFRFRNDYQNNSIIKLGSMPMAIINKDVTIAIRL